MIFDGLNLRKKKEREKKGKKKATEPKTAACVDQNEKFLYARLKYIRSRKNLKLSLIAFYFRDKTLEDDHKSWKKG